MKRRLLNWLYQRISERGYIPQWVFWIWKDAHWCSEMDDMLILDNPYDCFCGICPDSRECDDDFVIVDLDFKDFKDPL
jgi:hypothetical protein